MKANEHQFKQAVEKLSNTNLAKVSSLNRSDGKKPMFDWVLSKEALNVDHKIGII